MFPSLEIIEFKLRAEIWALNCTMSLELIYFGCSFGMLLDLFAFSFLDLGMSPTVEFKLRVLKNVLQASPKSDGYIISPFSVNRFPIRQVMTIKKTIPSGHFFVYHQILKTRIEPLKGELTCPALD